MNIVGIIPARMGSSRFPGKPLEKICTLPMIAHVYYRSKMAEILNEVYIATCDQEIADYIDSIGGESIMTSNSHERATERTLEACLKIEDNNKEKLDIIVMLQGDEPMILPEMIESAVLPLIKDSNIKVANLMSKINTEEECNDPNEVKVVVSQNNNALYFSRERIPSKKKYDKGTIMTYRQVCIIPFTRSALIHYNKLSPTPLEIIESIDMNRFLENGINVKMILTENNTMAVDTKKDLVEVELRMKNDTIIDKYINGLD